MDQTKIWDHFQNDDETVDVFNNALPRYKFIARQITDGARVLNIGVGRGGLEAILVKKGCLMSCLDPSANTIERLRKKHQLGDRAQTGFSQSMPFADNQFDVVVMSEVLEHLSDEVLNQTLIELRRVLKPQGRFVGTVPANENLRANEVMCPDCGKSFHRWGHTQSFSLERLSQLFSSNNFNVLRCETRAFSDWNQDGLKNFVLNSIRYVLGRMGSSLCTTNIFFDVRR